MKAENPEKTRKSFISAYKINIFMPVDIVEVVDSSSTTPTILSKNGTRMADCFFVLKSPLAFPLWRIVLGPSGRYLTLVLFCLGKKHMLLIRTSME